MIVESCKMYVASMQTRRRRWHPTRGRSHLRLRGKRASASGLPAAARMRHADRPNPLGGGTLHPIRSSRPNPLVLGPSCDGWCGAKGFLLGLPNRLEELMFRTLRNLALAALVAVGGLGFIPAQALAPVGSTPQPRGGPLGGGGGDAAPGGFVVGG